MNNNDIARTNEELFKYLQFIPSESFDKLQILPDDSKETCIYKLLSFLREFSDDDYVPYQYMANVFDTISKKFRLEILIKVFAKFFISGPNIIMGLFDKHMKEETIKEKEERINTNKAILSKVIKREGTISCYRKVSMGDVSPVWSFGFNTSYQNVKNSLYFTEGNVRVRIAGYCCKTVRIEDVLFCGDNKEIYLIPEAYLIENNLIDSSNLNFVDKELNVTQDNFDSIAGGFYDEFLPLMY